MIQLPFESREHLLQEGKRVVEELVSSHRVQAVRVRQVLRQVHDVPAAVGVGPLEVRVLDDADERKVRVVDVQPVGARQRAIEFEHEADVADVIDALKRADGIGARPSP